MRGCGDATDQFKSHGEASLYIPPMDHAPRIAWANVNYGPIWAPAYTSHMRALNYAAQRLTVDYRGDIHAIGATDRMYTHEAENRVVKDILDTPCTHIFFTENDMVLPDETIPWLLDVNQPIVTGVYYLRQGYGQPCLYRKVSQFKGQGAYGQSPVRMYPQDKPFRLNGCVGVGCLLVQKRVFETVPYPWFDLQAGHGQQGYGSDMFFFKKVRDCKIDVWVQPTVQCGQIEYVTWTQEDYQAAIAADPTWLSGGVIIGGAEVVPSEA